MQLGARRALLQGPAPAPECGAWGGSPHKTALHKVAARFQGGGWEAEGASRDSHGSAKGAGGQRHSGDTREAILSQGLPSFCGHGMSETPVKVLERSSQTGRSLQPTKPHKAHGCWKGDGVPFRNVPCSPPPSWKHFSLSEVFQIPINVWNNKSFIYLLWGSSWLGIELRATGVESAEA